MNITEEQMRGGLTDDELLEAYQWVISHDNSRIPTAEELAALTKKQEFWQAGGEPLWGWFLFPQRPSATDMFPCFAQTLSQETFPKCPSWKQVLQYSRQMAEILHCTQVFIVLDDGEDVVAVMANKKQRGAK